MAGPWGFVLKNRKRKEDERMTIFDVSIMEIIALIINGGITIGVLSQLKAIRKELVKNTQEK